MERYRIVQRKDAQQLAVDIQSMIQYGWTLVGGVAYGEGIWAQAIIGDDRNIKSSLATFVTDDSTRIECPEI